MAAKVVNDSANWASIWVKTVNLGSSEAGLPGGSAAAAINQIARVGAKIGVIVDTPRLREDGNYYAQVDTAAHVRISGTAGTATDGATVYITAAGAVTLTATGNFPIGYLTEAKPVAGTDIWVQLVPDKISVASA
ncbi:MAG: hypothetical protein K0S70_128 [Microbacterium sp.]|jgi:hypothetical protein|nr:hypothetical protein [Microbacterium sp.]